MNLFVKVLLWVLDNSQSSLLGWEGGFPLQTKWMGFEIDAVFQHLSYNLQSTLQ